MVHPRECSPRAQGGRHGCADEVDFIDAGNGDHGIGICRPGGSKRLGGAGDAIECSDIEMFFEIAQPLGIRVDDRDIVTTSGQDFSSLRADLTTAADNYVHGGSRLSVIVGIVISDEPSS